MKAAPIPWTLTKNSWRYTTIFDAEGTPICRLDLEDWSVTEGNQATLEKVQAQIARRIIDAVNAINNESSEELILRLLGEFKESVGSTFDDKIKFAFIAGARAALWKPA